MVKKSTQLKSQSKNSSCSRKEKYDLVEKVDWKIPKSSNSKATAIKLKFVKWLFYVVYVYMTYASDFRDRSYIVFPRLYEPNTDRFATQFVKDRSSLSSVDQVCEIHYRDQRK